MQHYYRKHQGKKSTYKRGTQNLTNRIIGVKNRNPSQSC